MMHQVIGGGGPQPAERCCDRPKPVATSKKAPFLCRVVRRDDNSEVLCSRIEVAEEGAGFVGDDGSFVLLTGEGADCIERIEERQGNELRVVRIVAPQKIRADVLYEHSETTATTARKSPASRIADQCTGGEDERATDDDLDHREDELRAEILRANQGDGDQFNADNEVGDD